MTLSSATHVKTCKSQEMLIFHSCMLEEMTRCNLSKKKEKKEKKDTPQLKFHHDFKLEHALIVQNLVEWNINEILM